MGHTISGSPVSFPVSSSSIAHNAMLLDEEGSVLLAMGCTGEEDQPSPSSGKRMDERGKNGCAAGVGKKGEWTGFDSGLGRLKTKGGEGSVVISGAKLGLPGSLPRWRAHLACHLGKHDKNVVGLLFAMANMYERAQSWQMKECHP